MPGPPPAEAAVRHAVRAGLARLQPDSLVLVACSGGADSLALAAATAFEAPRAGLRAGAVIVDHGLQDDSAVVADRAGLACRSLGLDPVVVMPVEVERVGGLEAGARRARYAALLAAARDTQAVAVLVGHTRDDQAEQVLLGLARGSGARSLSAMAPSRALADGVRLLRPLLGISRADTEQLCRATGLTPWRDPHNTDRTFARVRTREAVAGLEADLGPGVAAALARTASLLRDDADLLDHLADSARSDLGPAPVRADDLAALHPSLRRRVWLLLAAEAGAFALSATHVEALDRLVTAWRGQGPIDLPGGVSFARRDGRVGSLEGGADR